MGPGLSCLQGHLQRAWQLQLSSPGLSTLIWPLSALEPSLCTHSPFLPLPPGWGWILEEGMDLWSDETNQRDSLSEVAGLLLPGLCLLPSLPADVALVL